MKMMTVILVLMLAPITPSSAQDGANETTANCAARVGTACDYTLQTGRTTTRCCTLVDDAANTNPACFCLAYYQATTLYPDSTNAQFEKFLTDCNIPTSVYSMCSGSTMRAPPPPSPASDQEKENPETNIGMIIGIVAGIAVVIALIIAIIIFRCRRGQSVQHVGNNPQPEPNVLTGPGKAPQPSSHGAQVGKGHASLVTPESLQYQFTELQVATNNFSKENKIGRGGFGIVYKGTLLNGQEIAVKRLSTGSNGGDREFETEVVFLAKLRHRNLVKLLGFCLAGKEALLVYEFVPNKSLDYFLADGNKRAKLNWSRRYEIIRGVARGMMYLHEDSPIRIMHRDLKAANVLLDAQMHPKIADFGAARNSDGREFKPTHIVGTPGYMAPEYVYRGQFSAKSDVYSLGILILEIVSGIQVRGSSFNNKSKGEEILKFAWRCWEGETPLEFMDPMLRDSFSGDEVIKCMQLGLLSVQDDATLRPTMSSIVHALNSASTIDLPFPQHPAFIYSGSSYQTTTTTESTTTTTTTNSMAWSQRS